MTTPTRMREIRARLKLTQREFAAEFDLPWSTVRDWEQGASKPDRAGLAYLTVIGRDPNAVRNALAPVKQTAENQEGAEREPMLREVRATSAVSPAVALVKDGGSTSGSISGIRIRV